MSRKVGEGTTLLPATRKMSVIAQDPSVTTADGRILMARIDVPAEDLLAGPIGYRLQVVDYDASTGRYRGAHKLPESAEREPPSWGRGSPSIVGDFGFHAQNTYALVMKTLARFEFALGRRVGWSFGVHQLKAAPNGVMDANAFYSRQVEGLVFGYFQDQKGKPVYTCLSHDIVVHETTHALLDACRKRYMDPSGPDQAAFHEGFADVIALLSVYAQVELVAELLRRAAKNKLTLVEAEIRPEALRQTALFGLAEQMGRALDAVRGDALRRSAEMKPGKAWLEDPEFEEPHRRGEVLVAAVMNGFLEAWTARLRASKAPGQKSYNVRRVAEEGSDIAASLVTMWIRALDYMPPVHMEFADALTGAITADAEVRPDDSRYQLRRHMLNSFGKYGIKPAETRPGEPGAIPQERKSFRYERVRFESMRTDKDEVFRFIWENRHLLDVAEGPYTEVLSVRPCMRVGVDGFVLRETVAEYYQVAYLTEVELRRKHIRLPPEYVAEINRLRGEKAVTAERIAATTEEDVDDADDEADGGVTPIYGGGVLIFDEYGKLKYHVFNDIFDRCQTERLQHLWNAGSLRARAAGAQLSPARLSDLHRQRAIGARRFPAEGW